MVTLPEEKLSVIPTQDLLLELIRRSVHQDSHGVQIYRDLSHNRDLWKACTPGFGLCALLAQIEDDKEELRGKLMASFCTLIPLRDLEPDDLTYHTDEVYILSSGKDKDKLMALARSWNPDECEWLPADMAQQMLGGYYFSLQDVQRGESDLLRVWFD